MRGDLLNRDAQIRTIFALAPGAAFTAIAVAAALFTGLAIFISRCPRGIAVISRRLLVCRSFARGVFTIYKSQLRLAAFAVCIARFAVWAWAASIATATTTTFARLTGFAGLTFAVALFGVAIGRNRSAF